ncbi:MAG: alpha/beta fold hydrolase [Actinomycetota bacterium]
MKRMLAVGAVAAAAAGAAALATRRKAEHIRQSSDPYPLEQLEVEPQGATSYVERPDGTRIRVVSAGSGPTVVFAHGIYMTVIEWNVVWDMLLARGYRVVAFDQRGHGLSTIGSDGISTAAMASDYLAVLEHVEADDAVLLAHSMGGFLAVAAVLDVPGVAERLRGLILMSTFPGDVLRGAPQNKAQIPLIKSGMLQRMVANDTVGTIFGASICGDEPSPAMVQVFLDTFRAADHRALLPILEAFTVEDRGDRLHEITVPTIVLCGDKDSTTPPWQSERLAAGIPGAQAWWVPRAGHMLNWEAPDAIVEAIGELSRRPAAV